MRRRGAVMLAVLWVTVVLSLLASATARIARQGSGTSGNRVSLARTRWAAEACIAVASARGPLDSLELGPRTWCSARVESGGTRLNVNLAPRPVLARAIAELGWAAADADEMARAIESARRAGELRSLRELCARLSIPRGDSLRFAALFTVHGPLLVDVNRAPRELLAALPGLTEAAVDEIMWRRVVGPLPDPWSWAGELPTAARDSLEAHFAELRTILTARPTMFHIVATGHHAGSRAVAAVEITTTPDTARPVVLLKRVRA